MEFSAELHDFIRQDLRRLYPSLVPHVTMTIFDVAPTVLGMFDTALAEYAVRTFRRDGIEIKTQHSVESLTKGLPASSENGGNGERFRPGLDPSCGFTLRTKQEGAFGVGMCVWSTGLMMNPFVRATLARPWSLSERTIAPADARTRLATPAKDAPWTVQTHPRSGAILTDDRFRVKLQRSGAHGKSDGAEEAVVRDVFAIGDVAAGSANLPATAQVANQKAVWLAKHLNRGDLERSVFAYRDLGVMAFLGNFKAVMQGGNNVRVKGSVST